MSGHDSAAGSIVLTHAPSCTLLMYLKSLAHVIVVKK